MTAHTLPELGALFLIEARQTWPKSWRTITVHINTIVAWASGLTDRRTPLERITDDDGPQRFAMRRLQQVTRGTLRKELANLWNFFAWAKTHRYISGAPARPELPSRHKGTRSGTQREKAVAITPRQALAIIDLLPEWSAKGGRAGDRSTVKGAYLVRERFRFAYETGLRPGSVGRLEVPRHWRPGQRFAHITADIDKIGNERDVPLSRVAIAILERHAPKRGFIFGMHDCAAILKAAAAQVLDPDQAADFAPYDFRHGMATRSLSASGNNILGVAHLLGHTQVTTTNRYVDPAVGHAQSVIDTVSKQSGDETVPEKPSCEGGDLNPYGDKTASTSRQQERRNPQENEADKRQSTSPDTGETHDDETVSSGSRQEVAKLRGALAIQGAVWEALDAFTVAAEGDDPPPPPSPSPRGRR